MLKEGRLRDIRRMWRVKKPWFCVEKDGYPETPWVLSLADSHVTLPLLGPEKDAFAGLDRPLELRFSPGEDHPPPGTGEGLRLNDIAELGVPGKEI